MVYATKGSVVDLSQTTEPPLEPAVALESDEQLFAAMPVACLVTNGSGLVRAANAAAQALLGEPVSSLSGRPLLFYVAEQDRKRIVDLLERRSPPERAAFDVDVLPHGCEPRVPCSVRAAPVGDDARLGTRWVLFERRPESPRDQEDDLSHRKDQFLAILGHELRNPLASIQAGVELLSTPSGDHAREQALRIVRTQIRRMVRIIDDLLAASFDAQRRIRLHKGPVDVTSLVEVAASSVRDRIDQRGQHLSIELPSAALVVHADETRLAQVLSNLLDNASKYTPDGGVLGIVVEADDDACTLRVWDEGIGIAPSEAERVGMMFVQGRRVPERAPSGLGIGLSIAKMLVELHDGTLEIVPLGQGVPRGTEVIVRLPIGRPVAAAPPPREPTDHGRSRRVLVVEDNTPLAELFAELLESRGHVVVAVEDGWQALEAVDSFAPELVLVDIGLPGMSGYEVAARLRERVNEATMIVAVSGYSPDDAATGTFDAYVLKPISPTELASLLESLPDPDEPPAQPGGA